MPVFVTKTDFQRREYFRQLDSKEGNKILQNINRNSTTKRKKDVGSFYFKGMNSRFQRQMNRIQSIRNTKNKKMSK